MVLVREEDVSDWTGRDWIEDLDETPCVALPYLCARTARLSRAEAHQAQVLRRRLWDWHVSSWRCDGESGQSTIVAAAACASGGDDCLSQRWARFR
jgi:hypothetical protein